MDGNVTRVRQVNLITSLRNLMLISWQFFVSPSPFYTVGGSSNFFDGY